jgi:choice-of-anchor C domain-containing protein
MKILGLLAGAAMVLCAQSAYAVTIDNGSFEAPGVIHSPAPGYDTLGAGSPDLTGWTIGGAGIDHIKNYWNAQDGAQSVDVNGPGIGSIEQTISNLLIGQQYTVSFFIAATPGYGSQTLDVSFGSASQSYTLADSGSLGAMNWASRAIVFVATSTSALLKFAGTANPNNNAAGMALDNVTIAATPIPGALLLFGSALGGMGFLGFRRKKLDAAA